MTKTDAIESLQSVLADLEVAKKEIDGDSDMDPRRFDPLKAGKLSGLDLAIEIVEKKIESISQ